MSADDQISREFFRVQAWKMQVVRGVGTRQFGSSWVVDHESPVTLELQSGKRKFSREILLADFADGGVLNPLLEENGEVRKQSIVVLVHFGNDLLSECLPESDWRRLGQNVFLSAPLTERVLSPLQYFPAENVWKKDQVRKAFPSHDPLLWDRSGTRGFFFEADGAIVARACISKLTDVDCLIEDIEVSVEHREKGWGTLAVGTLHSLCYRLGYRKSILVPASTELSEKFYGKLGYDSCGTLGVYGVDL